MTKNTLSIKLKHLISQMTLAEKAGQMSQVSGCHGQISEDLANNIRLGLVGSVINEVEPNTINELQRIAVEESRLGIPLLIGRDVIHGFKTIFPIPLAQAATWSPELVAASAEIAALEAASIGVNWTFAPMIDITRDPRWGRIAESLGEDPYLCSQLGDAMIKGFQQDDLSQTGAIAACAKHFAGYGAAESGRDYNTTNISEHELRNVYFPPFKSAINAGVATFMSAFSDLNGVPASGNAWLMKDILRTEWQFNGMVVSDWESISQLSIHGLTENDKHAAYKAINAGIDMEMVSHTYQQNINELIDEGKITIAQIDQMVGHILSLKEQLGLFDQPYTKTEQFPPLANHEHLLLAKEVATKSCVLLKNQNNTLPLSISKLNNIAVIGPLADDGYEQLGTWIFDGEEKHSISCLSALTSLVGSHAKIEFSQGLSTSRSTKTEGFADAVNKAAKADVALMFMGEESILSGEAHCRADINLPGKQTQLIDEIAKTGTPIVLVIMAGRPITLTQVIDKVDAILFTWHLGSMAGPAITDLLFGLQIPSGKLPVTFPRCVGQIPIYYSHKNSGKPPSDATFIHMNDIDVRAEQTSLGMTATHLDTHFSPQFPFGFGLSYSRFSYHNLHIDKTEYQLDEIIHVSVAVTNIGNYAAEEIVQLYIRDPVASVTRPVKELKGFQRVMLEKQQSKTLTFQLSHNELAFYNNKMVSVVEPGKFIIYVGGDSTTQLSTEFLIMSQQ